MGDLYPKSQTPVLDETLFRHPTAEYRGAPFWAWGGKPERETLFRQIDQFRQMGFGGFHIHCRLGLDTPYLSREFLQLVTACRDRAKQQGLLCWLYDEDGYPSGFAGGLVTADPATRQQFLRITAARLETVDRQTAVREGKRFLVAAFDVQLDADGMLAHYARVPAETPAAVGCTRWYAYGETVGSSAWFNGQSYVNTMDKACVDRFTGLTLGAYKEAVGEDFGGMVPAIFTDEPNMAELRCLERAEDPHGEAFFHWTADLPETFQAAYGFDLVDHLPELVWQLPGGAPSVARWRYHDHACERFVQAFADNYGAQCATMGLRLTGHLLDEDTLCVQTKRTGEVMRSYRGFAIPGMDLLANQLQLVTAKQVQSAVHQYGREGMLSELYGVAGWDFDFRGYKLQGDWQAALGVTVRVPHLTWYTMKGSAKRDYPASIGAHSPWYTEFPLLEEHFARLNTVLTRGRPVVRIAVIHPIESDWVLCGPEAQTGARRERQAKSFERLTKTLLQNLLDFDYIAESQLPALAGEIRQAQAAVGEMTYAAVVVPECVTLRNSTLDWLERFVAAGGQVVFAGACPPFADAERSTRAEALYAACPHADGDGAALCRLLEAQRLVDVTHADGSRTQHLLHQLRQDGDRRWLFLARGTYPGRSDRVERHAVHITVKGEYTPTVYQTLTGDTAPIAYRIAEGCTTIDAVLYDHDSLLLRLAPPVARGLSLPPVVERVSLPLEVPPLVAFSRDEENVLLLDTALCRLDDGETTRENLLAFDRRIRASLGNSSPMGDGQQPWIFPDVPPAHMVTLTFTVYATAPLTVALAYESAVAAALNGQPVDLQPVGYYVDAAIHKTVPCLPLREGENTLVLQVPQGEKYFVENVYLLGDFDVQCCGSFLAVAPPRRQLGFASITQQGMPFYGGNITYTHTVTLPQPGDLRMTLPDYRGALVRVWVDDRDAGTVAFAPYQLTVPGLAAGQHTIRYRLYGHRENAFGRVVHNTAEDPWYGGEAFYPQGADYVPEYRQKAIGLMTAPRLELLPD